MVERLVKLLNDNAAEDKYLINYQKINSKELFFIKDKLDMNRAKSVEHCTVTLYTEVEEGGEKFLGSADFKAAPSMSDEEIIECINTSLYSASLVKNPKYELVKPTGEKLPEMSTDLHFENAGEILKNVIDLVNGIDKEHEASVNSMEIFLEDVITKVVNSEGVNETFSNPKLIIELVVDCSGEMEEVELYDMITVSSFDEEMLKGKITADFVNAQSRAKAKPLCNVKDVPIVLRGEAVKSVFSYYTFKADTAVVFKKYSQYKIEEIVQGEDSEGDKVNITLMPHIPFSARSKYIDADGIVLKELPLYKDGKLLSYHGGNRYSQYLGTAVTGSIPNVWVHAGSAEYDEMIKGECIEVLGFSDFQMDTITGDFGGEIRLAIHHKDGQSNPVSGGSVTGNITELHKNILLTKQMDTTENCKHPKAIKIEGAKISS